MITYENRFAGMAGQAAAYEFNRVDVVPVLNILLPAAVFLHVLPCPSVVKFPQHLSLC